MNDLSYYNLINILYPIFTCTSVRSDFRIKQFLSETNIVYIVNTVGPFTEDNINKNEGKRRKWERKKKKEKREKKGKERRKSSGVCKGGQVAPSRLSEKCCIFILLGKNHTKAVTTVRLEKK